MTARLKPLTNVIVSLFVLLFIGAIVYCRQRMLFLDAPHTLFRIINSGGGIITAHRYGSFVTQLLPLAGVWLHMPLAWIMLLYSISFNLFFLIVALLLVFRYNRYDLALLMGLYFTLFASAAFFWTNNEVHEGISWLFLAFAIFGNMYGKRPLIFVFPVFLVLFSLAIWTHPLIMIVALYLWLFLQLACNEHAIPKRDFIIYSSLLGAIILLKYYQSSHAWYDGDKIAAVKTFNLKHIRYIYKAPQLRFFVKGCITNYWLFVLLFITGNIVLIREKRYLLSMMSIGFTIGYILLIVITFWDEHVLRFYMESEYMPLTILACAPFVYFVLPLLKNKKMVALAVIIFSIRLFYIANAARVFTNRLTVLEHLNENMAQKKLTKVIMPDNNAALDSSLLMSWGLPVESLMLSALKKEYPQRTIILADPGSVENGLKVDKNIFIGCFEKSNTDAINPVYFRVDTSAPYKKIFYTELVK